MIDRGNMLTHAFPVDYTNKKYFSAETGFGTSLDDNTAFQTFVISSDILHIRSHSRHKSNFTLSLN